MTGIDWASWPDAQLAVAAEFCSRPEDQQAIAAEIASRIERQYAAKVERYELRRALALRIADETAGPTVRYIARYGGIQESTRRVACGAAIEAALRALDVICPDCGRVPTHAFDCERARTEAGHW